MTTSVGASHILLMYAGSSRSSATRSKEEAAAEIAAILKELQEGGDFAALAGKHSDCPSGKSGGDLGTFGRGNMVKAFEDSAFGMDVGGMSDIVETDFGFHIIKRTS